MKKLEKENLGSEENIPGIYEILSEQKEVLYVGTGPLRSMICEHLENGVFPMEDARYYRRFTCGTELESQRRSLLEDHILICGRKPKYNRP